MATVGSVTAAVFLTSLHSSTSGMRHLSFIRDDEIVGVPLDRLLQAFHDPNRRAVAEQARRLGGVGARELQVAAPRLAMNGFHMLRLRTALRDARANHVVELDQRGLVAEREVVGLAEP